ncbi:hypothetical protein Golomagni_06950 [Golovinomyces magnicellulatus]|nr:hypothetical protein Golomagni_06950 [Golovinomyces magnicellulatus]
MSWRMSLLTAARDERVILATIGLAAFGIISTIFTGLTLIRDDSEIPPVEPKTQYITQETEDTLHLDTLDKLVEHPNYSIRDVALRILSDRAINDTSATNDLIYGITRPEYDYRLLCLQTLALLGQQVTGVDSLSQLHSLKTYSAFVRSLELSLDDTERPLLDDPYWDDYYLRDSAEKYCIRFLQELTSKYGANLLVRAKFVEKWLVKQEWGKTDEDRQRNFREYMNCKNNRIVEIVTRVRHCKPGLRALEKCKLIDRDISQRRMRELPDLLMEDIVGDPNITRPRRTREHSAEERRLRRQHREAMVLNDGTRPLAREDIIERDHGSPA